MTLVSKTYWAGAPFRFASPPRDVEVEPRVLRTEDFRDVEALWWTPRADRRPRVAVVAMHPRVDFTRHYAFPRLLAAGFGCLGASPRSPNHDTDTRHEELLLDLAACVRWLREHRAVRKVVLLGNSGGGSLSALYQAQASTAPAARLERAPCGRPVMLRAATMIPADAMIYVAAHRGQGKVLERCIDPSVVDEHDPLATDASLDMYDPRNGFRAPPSWTRYEEAFAARFRAGQAARVRRLDAAAVAAIERGRADGPGGLTASRRRALETVMVVYRTMASLAYVDDRIEPSGRDYGSLLSERPDLMNYRYLGFARTVTPSAWLSTWSANHSRADLVDNVAAIDAPSLFVSAGRDREVHPGLDVDPAFEAAASTDKARLSFLDARHYFEPEPGDRESPAREALMDALVAWTRERT